MKVTYILLTSQDVLQDIRSTIRGDYRDLCTALLHGQATQYAELLNYSVKGLGTNKLALIHNLASRSQQVCTAILETDPVAMACNILLQDQAIQDAELLNYTVKGLGTNEMALIHILASRSPQVCTAILDIDPVTFCSE